MNPNPYTIKAQAAGGRARVYIHGDIGPWANDAGQFRRDVQALGNVPIDVHIASGGGNANDGIQMYTFLASLPDVHTYADAGVASAATLPYLAGKRRFMATASSLMIHNPWDIVAGDAGAMRDAADGLEFAAARLAEVYAKVTGLASEVIRRMMDATTWIDTTQALAEKWATDVVEGSTAQANIAPGRYKGTPKNLVLPEPAAPQPPQTPTMKNLTAALAKAGLIASADVAEDVAVQQLTTNHKALVDAKAKADADIATAQREATDAKAQLTRANEALTAYAKATLDESIRSGRIAEGVRAKWEESLKNDAKGTLDLLAGLAPQAHGHPPLPISGGSAPGKKSYTEQCREAKAKAGGTR